MSAIHRELRRAARLLPGRWVLPAIARIDQSQSVEPEIAYLGVIGPCRGLAIDVGANYGLYSYALSKLYREVIAFEPNRSAALILAAWKSPRVRLEHFALSSKAGPGTLFVPGKGDVEMSGWASLYSDNCPDAERVTGMDVELRTLDSFGFTDVGFIKIDAEGHELEVLQGAQETIAASRPNLLVEVRKNRDGVLALLASWGYRGCTLHDLVGKQGTPANMIFRTSPVTA